MIKFFSIVSLVTLVIGAAIGLFDLMYDEVVSALLCFAFLVIGGAFGLAAGWQYFKQVDKKNNRH